MADLSHKDRTISTKIVYYGPAMSGKTTNIQVLHEHAGAARRGELVSVNTAQDRTIMFDLLPIKIAAFMGFDLKVRLVAVPGQPMYAAIRRLTLKDVDSLVFVADSAAGRLEENVTSLQEMLSYLGALPVDAASLPLVLQYNKRDLADVVPTQVMDRTLNTRQTTAIPAVAIRGEGVLETFSAILTLTVADLARRYRLKDMGRSQTVEEWSAAAVQEIFGTRSFPASAHGAGEVPGRRTVRLTLPADVSTAERLDARTNEALVESYAQAATALGEGAQRLAEERDLAQRRLANVLRVLEAARTLKPGGPREPLLAVVLGCLAEEVDAPHASLLVPAPNQSMTTSALQGLDRDPILCHAEAMPRLRAFLHASSPRWHETDHDPVLHEILASSHPPHGSIVSVPLTAGQDPPIGVALLYRSPSAPPPRRESLKHLADMARLLAPFLESSHSGGDGDSAARELLGAAFRLAAPRQLSCLRELRQRLAEMRRRPDGPVWLPAALAEIAPILGEATSIGRSLAALDTGTLEDERVEVGALLRRVDGDVQVEAGAGVTTARVNPTLFGLALGAIIDRARRHAEPDRVVQAHCVARGERLVIRIGVAGPVALGPTTGADQCLVFPTKVIELHGGRLSVEVDPTLGSWVLLDVAAG